MYFRLILITLILSYVTSKNNCVLYVFDSEFNKALNLVDCDSETNDVTWQVVHFEKDNILPRSKDSINALLGTTNSCAKFEIGFLSKGTLEADVFVSTPSCVVSMGSVDTVISYKSSISSSGINSSDNTSDLGWRKLSVNIEKDIENALITLQASCSEGYALVTSFKHIPHESSKQHCKTISKQNLSNIKNTKLTHKDKDISVLQRNVRSNADDVDVVITNVLRNDEESFWTPLTISLISSSIVIVLIILAVTAYQCGKSKGLDEVNDVFWNDTERTLTIPRARSIYSQSISRSQHSGQFPTDSVKGF